MVNVNIKGVRGRSNIVIIAELVKRKLDLVGDDCQVDVDKVRLGEMVNEIA